MDDIIDSMFEDPLEYFTENKQWMTNDGEILNYDEITTSHLKNIINFLKRKYNTCIPNKYEKNQLISLEEELSSR